jgi:hypothetical protein
VRRGASEAAVEIKVSHFEKRNIGVNVNYRRGK